MVPRSEHKVLSMDDLKADDLLTFLWMSEMKNPSPAHKVDTWFANKTRDPRVGNAMLGYTAAKGTLCLYHTTLNKLILKFLSCF